MAEDRPPIPKDIKREVRQRCGFGCVICGNPFYEYDHMYEWAKYKRHVASEITLLCKEHHGEKTSGRMPHFVVNEANKSPFNLRNKYSPYKFLYYSGNKATIKMGGTEFTITDDGTGAFFEAIKIGDFSLMTIKLQDNHFLLSIYLCDIYNNPIFIIEENNFKYALGYWDIEFTGTRIIIRQASRDIFIKINFQTPNIVNIESGKFYYNGNKFYITKKGIEINEFFSLNNIIVEGFKSGITMD